MTLIKASSGLKSSKCPSKLTDVVIHFGSRSSNYTYNMHGKPLKIVQEESDLGVTISSDLKQTAHCKKTYNKANAFFGFIARNFECKAK